MQLSIRAFIVKKSLSFAVCLLRCLVELKSVDPDQAVPVGVVWSGPKQFTFLLALPTMLAIECNGLLESTTFCTLLD